MLNVRVTALAGAVAVSLLPGLPRAQASQQQAPPVFRSRADLVRVYVVAVDEQNNPVMDLTAGDFSLRDRGRPQEIAVFDPVSRPPESAPSPLDLPPDVTRDVASNRGEDSDRVVIVLVDDLHMYRKRDEKAREVTRQIINELSDGSMMALLFTSGENGTQITDDHAEVLRTVDKIKGRRPQPRPADSTDMQSPPRHDPENVDSIRAAVAVAQRANLQDFFDNLTFYRTMRDVAKMLRADDGRRKVFVLVSEGIGKDLSWLPGGSSPRDGTAERMSFQDEAALDMIRELRRANVATYAVDPRGFVPDEKLLSECRPSPGFDDPCWQGLTHWSSDVRQAQQGMEISAELSGGFAVTNTDQFTDGIAKIRSDLDNYYLLGFYPSVPTGKGFRELKIDVTRPGVTLRFRQGYEVVEPEAPKPGRDALTTLLTGALPNGDLPLRIFAAPFPGAGRTATVVVTIEIAQPLAAVADDLGNVSDSIRYSLLAADVKSGKAAQQLENTATLSSATPMGAAAPPIVFYQVPMTMNLAPGHYQLRASAISEKAGSGGSVYLSLEVPDFQRTAVAVSGLVIGSTTGPKIPSARPPKPTDLVPFSPSLSRQFDRGDTLRVVFQVARQAGRAADVRFEVLDAAGKQAATTIRVPMPEGDPGQVDIKLPLADLAPGAYRLRVTALNGNARAERETGIVVR